MKKLFFVAIIISIFAAFFASSHPDGLDFVSEKLAFNEKGVERTSIMTDYAVPVLPEGWLANVAAGIAGVLITVSIFWLIVYIIKDKGDDKMNKYLVFALACMFVLSSGAFAARPLGTDDFGTVDPGQYELEVGYSNTTPKIGGSSGGSSAIAFKRGIMSGFDLGIEIPYAMTGTTGLNDISVNAKYRILEQGEKDGLTAKVIIKLANGDSALGLGSSFMDYTLAGIYSKALGDVNTHYNLAYTLVGVAAGASQANVLSYGIAGEMEIAKGIDAVAEFTGTSSPSSSTNNMLLGGRMVVNDMLTLDAGYSLALNDSSNNVITAGLTAGF